jgi:membrane dipeptidase
MLKALTVFALSALFVSSVSAQSYKRLHKKAVLADTHNDVLSATMKGMDIGTDLSGKTHSDLDRFKKAGVDIQVFSIFCDERFGKDTAFKFANLEMDSLYAIARRNPDKMNIVTNAAELKQTLKEKKLAAMMGVEGGHMIEDQISNLDSLFKKGARYMTLTWNNSTSWASSAADESAGKLTEEQKGLTALGKDIVKRMNQLGMMVDISHTGEKTFWDAIHTTTKPLIASHSSVWSICPVPRNLKDDQIRAIGKNGGVIFVNFYSGFIDSNYLKRKEAFVVKHRAERDSLRTLKKTRYEIDEILSREYPEEVSGLRPPLSALIDHIDYIAKMIGADHVGVGSDFDGIESAPRELDDVTGYPAITRELRKRGYSKKDIRKILGGNFLRVFKANMGG